MLIAVFMSAPRPPPYNYGIMENKEMKAAFNLPKVTLPLNMIQVGSDTLIPIYNKNNDIWLDFQRDKIVLHSSEKAS